MAKENYTTFTELDPGEDITITADTITLTEVDDADGTRIYKDYTADHFTGDFTHDFDLLVTSLDANNWIHIYALANVATGEPNFSATAINVTVYSQIEGTKYQLYLYDYNWDQEDSSELMDLATPYYLTITRVDNTYTLYIYTDEARTALFDSVIITESAATDFRYLYQLTTGGGTPGDEITGTLKNLDLHEAVEKIKKGVVARKIGILTPQNIGI